MVGLTFVCNRGQGRIPVYCASVLHTVSYSEHTPIRVNHGAIKFLSAESAAVSNLTDNSESSGKTKTGITRKDKQMPYRQTFSGDYSQECVLYNKTGIDMATCVCVCVCDGKSVPGIWFDGQLRFS